MDSAPQLAHRQRVMVLRLDPGRDAVRAEQLFCRGGPTDDRPPLAASLVQALGPEAFDRHPGCDLLFETEPALDRFRARMDPGACRYRRYDATGATTSATCWGPRTPHCGASRPAARSIPAGCGSPASVTEAGRWIGRGSSRPPAACW